jgi:predicted DNA-binding protein
MEKYKTHMVYLKGKGETLADEKRRIKKIKTLAERIGKTKSGAVRLMIDAYEMKE